MRNVNNITIILLVTYLSSGSCLIVLKMCFRTAFKRILYGNSTQIRVLLQVRLLSTPSKTATPGKTVDKTVTPSKTVSPSNTVMPSKTVTPGKTVTVLMK